MAESGSTADERLLPQPIVTLQPIVTAQNSLRGTRTRNDFGALEDILDDETELLEEELVELLARSAR